MGGGLRLYYQSGIVPEDGQNVDPEITQSKIYANQATLYGGGIQARRGGRAENCLIYDNRATLNGGGVYLYLGGTVHSCTIAHNDTDDATGKGPGLYTDGGGSIENSIIMMNPNIGVFEHNDQEASVTYNYCLTYPYPYRGTGNIQPAYPKFRDAASRDYYLLADSPCIDFGGNSSYPTEDFTGFHRPLDGPDFDTVQQRDIGAYEYKEDDDSDGDGMPTYWENLYGLPVTHTNLLDELPDFHRNSLNGSPAVSTNSLGEWVVTYTSRLNSANALDGAKVNSDPPWVTDADLDGLWNIYEYSNGCNPQVQDTDGDGIDDYKEVYGRYAVPFGSIVTDPTKADTDGDGFNDKFEIDSNSDPRDPASYLTTLAGTISYSGSVQTGPVRVSVSNTTVAVRTAVIAGLGGYTVTNLPTLEALVVTAYRDSNSNSLYDLGEALGTYTGNPVPLTGPGTGINIILADPTTTEFDFDDDGLSDFFEVYTSFTLPDNFDSDGDTMRDGWEWTYRASVSPTNAADKFLDPDDDGLANVFEFAALTDPGNPDTDGDSMPDGWEWYNWPAVNPTNAVDWQLDPDADGLINSNEYVWRTNPNLWDTDGDGMPDGWEAQYATTGLSPTNHDAAAGYSDAPDYDLMSNIDEYRMHSNPTLPDSDFDGMIDGWEFHYTNVLNLLVGTDGTNDPDGDGLSNLEEYTIWADPAYPFPPGVTWGPHPDVADSDGDGVDDGNEIAAGTNPKDPNSYPVVISGQLAAYSGIQSGVLYAVASQRPSGQVYWSAMITNALTNAVSYRIENVAMLTNYTVHAFMDSNANASQDVWEATGTFNGTNGLPFLIYLTNTFAGANITLADDPALDSDGDTVSDLDEVYVYGTDPLKRDTDGDSMPDWWEILYTNACNPNDPTDWDDDVETDRPPFIGDGVNNSNEYVNSSNPEVSDTDGDGLGDQEEIDVTFTKPDVADSDGDGLNDGEEVNTYGTNPNNPDTDGDMVSDGDEVAAGTDPKDPASFPATISGDLIYTNGLGGTLYAILTDGAAFWTNSIATPGPYAITNLPTLTNYTVSAYRDTNGDLMMDTWEAQGTYTNGPIWLTNSVTHINVWLTHPTVDTDGDGLTDYDEVNLYLTNPNTNDTDGDSMLDGWEVLYPLAVSPIDPNDWDGDAPDHDGLINSNEHRLGTSPELWDTDGDSMPDGWEARYTNALNPTVQDGTNDYAGEFPSPDGLVNSNEYIWGTNPELWDTDGDGVSDGQEVASGSDPTNAASYLVDISGAVRYTGAQTGPVYAILQTSGAGTTSNVVTLFGVSGPYVFSSLDTLSTYDITAFRDSNMNGVLDTWEASGSYVSNSIVNPTGNVAGVDIDLQDPTTLDSDGDGLTDMDEVYIHGSKPDDDDTDDDFMLDGWEYANRLAVNLLVPDGDGDFDSDGLVNSNEYFAMTDPNDVDSDGDSMPDGWEWDHRPAVNPTNSLDWQLDSELPVGDGLINSNEYVWRTNPNLWDTDGDSMPDGWEVTYAVAVNPTNGLDGAIDYSGETNAAGDVMEDGLVNSNEYIWGTSPLLWDTDGDGVSDGAEVDSGTDPTNPTSKPITISGFLWNATLPSVSGEVYVVLSLASNTDFFASYDMGVIVDSPPPLAFAVTNVPNRSNYWVSAFIDVNSNSTFETWEPYGVQSSATPAENDVNAGGIRLGDSELDTDGDGLTDYDEVYLHFTSPTNPDSDGDEFSDFREVRAVYWTDPNDIDSFPASIGGLTTYSGTKIGPVRIVVTNESLSATNGPYSIGSYATPTNYPTLTNYYVMGYIDENTNGVLDTWEARGFADTYPIDLVADVGDANIALSDPSGDSDGDGLSDYEEHFRYFTNPYTNDTDGDTMLDGWEVVYTNACDPNNPADAIVDYDGDGLTNLEEHNLVPQTNPEDDDSDDDGLTDGDEVNPYLTQPMNADTDGDGMPDGWEVTYIAMLNPLVADAFLDPDGDGLWNLQEYEDSMTDPTNPDTDGEGLTDFEEHMTYHTIPTNSDTDADGFTDYEEVIEIGSMATNAIDPYVVDDNAPGDPVAGNPNISNPDEDGHLPTPMAPFSAPFDAIQEAVDSAPAGYTVLVLDGVYQGFKNRDINPGGKAITIRSRNGYATTQIYDSSGGGFICSNGETTNTVIQGFTVRTRVVELGAPGVTCVGASPTIKECWFYDCGQAGVRCQQNANPLILDCLFQENEGGVEIQNSSPMVERCTMLLNQDGDGAGLHISGTSQPHIVNCVIVQNVATNLGGGFYVGADAEPIFVNCTVADNVASVGGGGFHNAGALHFWNAVLWGNQAPVGPGYHLLHSFESGYSCLQTLHLGGLNNIDSDPQFAGVGNYDLKSTSPCIDAGIDQQSGIHAPEDDRDGVARIPAGGTGHSKYDMGAYEYVPGGRIFIQTPGGTAGETLTASLTASVEWTWESNVGTNVNLHYTFDFLSQNPTWHTIATNVYRGTNGTGSYLWSVPQTNASRCYVRVADSTNSQVEGVSPFEFAIADGVKLFAPNGGAAFYIGQTADVSWASSSTTNTTVDFVLSVDGGVTYDVASNAVAIASGITNTVGGVTNTIPWAISNSDTRLLTANGRLQVATADGVFLDDSDASFSVLGLIVTQPVGGSGLATGSTVEVRWRTVGAGASVDVDLSTNSGATYMTLTNGLASVDGTNSYTWTLGNTPTSNAVLRIRSLSDTNVVGVSGEFRITDGSSVFGLADLDADGMPDAYEIANGLDYQSASLADGADGDLDGDGFVNSAEMFAGTDPQNPGSWIGVLSMRLKAATGTGPDGAQEAAPALRWSAVIGRDYRIESASSPAGAWLDASGTLRADKTEMDWVDPSGAPPPRFYRIIVLSE